MKTVVITGGSMGIGEALVKRFLKEKDYRILSLDIVDPASKLEGVIYRKVDIRSPEEVQKALEGALSIDILINNAAMQFIRPLREQTQQEIESVLNTNILGTINITRAALPKLAGGLILNIGSVHSRVPRKNKIPYDISKAALRVLTEELALEEENRNIRVNCVEFGAVKTPMNNDFINKEEAKQAVAKQVIDHLLTSEEAADIIYELTKDKYKYMNGSTLVYDCGRTIKG